MFEWDDEPPRTNNGAGAGGSFGAGNQPGGSRDQDVCYKVCLSTALIFSVTQSPCSAMDLATGLMVRNRVGGFCVPSLILVIACPNGEGSANKRARSFGSKADNRSPVGACYKCNEEGHYSAG
jgi:hypothetical protein